MTKTIPFTTFRAHSSQLVDEVSLLGITIILTKRGEEVGRLIPPPKEKKGEETIVGCMKGTIQVKGDIISPLDVIWTADEKNISG